MLSGIRNALSLPTIAAVAGGTALLTLSAAGTALAAPARPGYGPPPPPPPPGGRAFHCVVTSRGFGPSGGSTGPIKIQGLQITLHIRPGTLPSGAELTVTAPYLASAGCAGQPLQSAGFPGDHALGGVGVLVQVDGSNFAGLFPRPIIETVQSAAIGRKTFAAAWNGYRFVRDRHVRAHQGYLTIQLRRSTDIAIVGPGSGSLTSAGVPAGAADFISAALLPAAGAPQGTGVTLP